MSVKRQATSDLNHDNWNDDDPSDEKEMGTFKPAPKDVVEKRVIRTAKRRIPVSSQSSQGVFSGFGGFNKAQPSSFDFLANLTNGSKNTNGSTGTTNSEATEPASLSALKPANTQAALSNSGGLFSSQTTSSPSKTSQPSTWTSPFASSVKTTSSLFSTTNADSAIKDTPFKIQPVSSSMDSTKSAAVATTSANNDSKSLFSSTNSTPFKIQPVSSTTTAMVQTSFGVTTPAIKTDISEKKSDETGKPNEKKIKYFSKLKGLNEAVSDWISKHVVQTPLCILSPIFRDYEKYLKEITDEYQNDDNEENDKKMDTGAATANLESTKTSPFGLKNDGIPAFSSQDSTTSSSPFTLFTSKSSNDTKPSAQFANSSTPMKPQETKISTPLGSKNSDVSAFNSSPSKLDTKASTPFGTNSSSPLAKLESKTSPFAINTGSVLPKADDTKTSTPFGVNNTSTPFNSSSNKDTKASSLFTANNTGSNLFNTPDQNKKVNSPFAISNSDTPSSSPLSTKSSLFGAQNNIQSTLENKQAFSFGIKTSPSNISAASTPNSGFSFGVTSSSPTSTFAVSNASVNPTSTASFSFGSGKPFSFSTNNVQQSSGETAATENEDEEPPKVEYTPVKEDNSVYEKKCKVFVKKDGNFVDKGVGTLYVKKIEGNAKHQLLVRANTNLGTVLLNLVLAEAIPTQRMGKNNVMLVCIPIPGAEPPPTPVLIRVKTGEEADELLETLNKYKA